MCDPVTIAIIVSSALEASSKKQAGDAQKAIADQNATIARYQAKDALAGGVQDTQQEQQRVAAILGSERAGLAGNGVVLDSGSALGIQENTASVGAKNEEIAWLNALRRAWGYRTEALSYETQGKFDQAAGNNAAIGSLLTGAGQAGKFQSGSNGGQPQTFGGSGGASGGYSAGPDAMSGRLA